MGVLLFFNSLELFSLGFFKDYGLMKFLLFRGKGVLSPCPECFPLIIFDTILQSGFQKSPACFELFERFKPRVESPGNGGMNES
jgi:hypothetical protein